MFTNRTCGMWAERMAPSATHGAPRGGAHALAVGPARRILQAGELHRVARERLQWVEGHVGGVHEDASPRPAGERLVERAGERAHQAHHGEWDVPHGDGAAG